ncbi:metal-dependent hydrolase [Oceaniglobus roseus]|uniref:metal-dependent hydrolase n=1 Tax=Oceaniglobus roseus TaxID=1737570 RepID=UPI000C7F0CB4|nr:metal-dependent hydrolase [Kandeliimicrobium roseum]
MKITWLGHGSFRIEVADQVLLIDPWFTGNPVFPEGRKDEAVAGATHVLLTHGHGDHASDAASLGLPVAGMVELMSWLGDKVETTGFNKGGTITLGQVKVTMVNAVHSSSSPDGKIAGSESGFMISGEGKTLYFSGDTDIMADMEWMGELHKPDIGILCAGGHYTMDMERAAWAAKRYFKFRTVIPGHYKTFPALAQSADAMIAALPDVQVLTPEVMETVEV